MLTILIFSLVFTHNSLSRKDPRDYKCHVENATEISGSIRSLNISLQASRTAATMGKLHRTYKVITLECFRLQSLVQVNLLYLEKMHRDWGERAVEKCTLQSLKVITGAGRKPPVSHTCVLLTHHRKKSQRKDILGEKERIPSTNCKDMVKRQKICIAIKVLIVCSLLAFAMLCITSAVLELLCLWWCPGWSRRRRAAPVLLHGPAAPPTPLLTGTEPPESLV